MVAFTLALSFLSGFPWRFTCTLFVFCSFVQQWMVKLLTILHLNVDWHCLAKCPLRKQFKSLVPCQEHSLPNRFADEIRTTFYLVSRVTTVAFSTNTFLRCKVMILIWGRWILTPAESNLCCHCHYLGINCSVLGTGGNVCRLTPLPHPYRPPRPSCVIS